VRVISEAALVFVVAEDKKRQLSRIAVDAYPHFLVSLPAHIHTFPYPDSGICTAFTAGGRNI
jgi:hypothetical protein